MWGNHVTAQFLLAVPTTPHTEPEPDRQFGRSTLARLGQCVHAKLAAESLKSRSFDEYKHEKRRSLEDTDGKVCIFDVKLL